MFRLFHTISSSLRGRLMLLVSAALLLGVLLGTASIIFNARISLHTEGDTFALYASNVIRHILNTTQPEEHTIEMITPYVSELNALRHVSVHVEAIDKQLPTTNILRIGTITDTVPHWFKRLLITGQSEFHQEIIPGGPQLGRIVVSADLSDEIIEAWQELLPLLKLAAILLIITLLLLYRAVNSGLAPLNELLSAFEKLERTEFPVNVREDVVLELKDIHQKFNRVAGILQSTLADNQELAAHMVNLREEERNTLARELHDELSPHLFAIKMKIEAAQIAKEAGKESAMFENLENVAHMAAELKQNIRRMLQRLRPQELNDIGLRETLLNLINNWQSKNPEIHCTFDISGEIDNLKDVLQITIYRAVQEALTNITKHADTNTAIVRVEVIPVTTQNPKEMIEIEVRDAGRSASPESKPGLGLRGMRERVQSLGGSLDIFSDHKGFRVLIKLPVERVTASN